MSRIADALRHADRTGAMPPPPPPPAWAPRRAGTIRFNRVETATVSATIPILEPREQISLRAQPEVEEMPERADSPKPSEPLPGFLLTMRRLVSARFGSGPIGRTLIKIGVLPRATFQVPRCSSVTRNGTPCKAPAMANGRCRMHGGSKQRGFWELAK